MPCSPSTQKYFDYLVDETNRAHAIAKTARKLGYDPQEFVEIKLAKNMAERVVGIISVVAPQIIDSGVTDRIIELEKEYASQDWRVAFKIALEIAQQKYCKFESDLEAIEVGVRTGFAYVTVGVVSSPLEGLTSIEIKKRRDGQGEYFRLNYAGPIRNAGGTAAATSVLIADYVRKHLGYAKYDPTDKEVQRCAAELEDYHQYIANLQYNPHKKESEFLMQNIPVEIAGDPSEKRELSNAALKDLPRIETNLLRSGYCLIHSSCIPLKAPKLWKKLAEWGHEMGMEDWDFLKEHIKLQKELKAQTAEKTTEKKEDEDSNAPKIKPDGVFVADLVGGRPVLGHPMRSGAFRLRYGRGRASGYSGQSAHPATLAILDDMIATGTQLKVERPGKAAAFTPCDTIMGPTVLLDDGSVRYLTDPHEASRLSSKVKEILYLGDALINYGDFFDRAHILIPPGYCEEYWAQEVKAALLDQGKVADEKLAQILDKPLRVAPGIEEARKISDELGVPLHPAHIFFYKEVCNNQFSALLAWLAKGTISQGVLQLPNPPKSPDAKRALELLGITHTTTEQSITLDKEIATAFLVTLNADSIETLATLADDFKEKNSDVLTYLNHRSNYTIKDKSGIFIGARMGRPEKAKMRKMTGSPHSLFPVGEEGGRLRSFNAALEKGRVTADFPVYLCPNCKTQSPLSICYKCENKAVRQKIDWKTDTLYGPVEAQGVEELKDYKKWVVPLRDIFDSCLKRLGTRVYPDLIKGVRGTVGRDHTPEHLLKGILRAKNNVHVNKDGTIRYDASEITLTHFKPKEVGTSIEKLKSLGYTHDVDGNELVDVEQVLELRAQDLVLPACPDSPEDGSDIVLLNTTKYVDDELRYLYGLKPYYNAKRAQDLVGHLIIGLAPHTSAGMIGRIIGFSKTQGMLAHPLYHAAMRRDCDGDEGCFLLIMDAFLNFSQKYLGTARGSTMDAPLVLTTLLNPAEVDDMAFNVDIVKEYPLEFYKACEEYKYPWDVKIRQINDTLFTPDQFEGMHYTHDTTDINVGVLCSSYKLLPSMGEKIQAQMGLASKIRAVDESDVARLIIEKHFIRDTKGNLRKFSLQQFRCVNCNTKYRRPPLMGRCTECSGKVIFTISEGSVIKYLEPSMMLAQNYVTDDYLKQTLELLKVRIEYYFGKDKEKQLGLADWFKGGS